MNKKIYKNGNFFTNWLRGLSLKSKFLIIIILIIVVLLVELGNFWFAMRMMSAVRTYVAGEDFWSKAQKNANYYLRQYAVSQEELDYKKVLENLQIIYSDRNARLEMEEKDMDINYVTEEFKKGNVDPRDIKDAAFLYRNFQFTSYIKDAVKHWSGGEAKVDEFRVVADKMHEVITADYNKDDSIQAEKRSQEISNLAELANKIDSEATILETNFAMSMGDTSRAIKNILLFATVILTFMLGIFIISIAKIIQDITIQVDNTKNEFVSLASHQLRTPATTVKWYTEAILKLKNEPLGERTKKYLGEISYGSEKIISLINVLLNVAHVELGKIGLNVILVDCKSLLEKVINTQNHNIIGSNKDIIIKQGGEPLQVFTDPVILSTILENIISNAIKYTKENGEIICSIELIKSKVIFAIKDNGIGIPEEEQKRIFEKLFRASNAISHEPSGNGLGLYAAKVMADALKGRLWFESHVNKGSIFYLELPLNI